MINRLIDLYSMIIIAAVIVSWIDISQDHPLVRILRQATEPVLGPVRQALPATGGIDLSPFVVIIGLRLLGGIF
jgi:YggT family protein